MALFEHVGLLCLSETFRKPIKKKTFFLLAESLLRLMNFKLLHTVPPWGCFSDAFPHGIPGKWNLPTGILCSRMCQQSLLCGLKHLQWMLAQCSTNMGLSCIIMQIEKQHESSCTQTKLHLNLWTNKLLYKGIHYHTPRPLPKVCSDAERLCVIENWYSYWSVIYTRALHGPDFSARARSGPALRGPSPARARPGPMVPSPGPARAFITKLS